ncbi:MAG: diaminopimelate epimerase [Phycisphaerales bacterium]|nr:diaminopimelate epimerase [Phycisphaerales bacterium]
MTITGMIPFSKWHGLENDYVLIEQGIVPEAHRAAFARCICNRRTGIGADGLLICDKTGTDHSTFQIVNADGTDAELCGNGLRCAAAWLSENAGVERVFLTSSSGRHEATVAVQETNIWMVEMELGNAIIAPVVSMEFGGSEIELRCATVGNPHAILFEQTTPDIDRLADIAEAANRLPNFPNGVNVHHACVRDDGSIALESFERGAGAVQACATGAAAAASLMCSEGGPVVVRMPGGELNLHIEATSGLVRMKGPACRIAVGECVLPDNLST